MGTSKKKKICFVTAARSEYGLLKWLMADMSNSASFDLQVIVTGAHLLWEQGHTIDQITEDGFQADAIIDVQLDTSSLETIASSMGRMAEMFAPALKKLCPDYLLVLGDRYELLPICNTAFVMRIPIIHLSGGDVTTGAIDDGIRNAVTMLATYHFPGTRDSAENIIRMRGSDGNVWAVGEPGLDSFYREKLLSRNKLAEELSLDAGQEWVLFTYHAETVESLEHNLRTVKNCVQVLEELTGYQVIATYSNADFGGKYINEYLEEVGRGRKEDFIVVPSLGNRRYLSLMKQVRFVIGNSSSGIVEAPALRIPVVNIGNRQKGRHLCSNVIQTETDYGAVKRGVEKAITYEVDASDVDYWGDGKTSGRIVEILEKVIENG